MSTQKIVWNYAERVATGLAILAIGSTSTALGYYFQNPFALLLGIFAISLGAHRIGYAHGMRDMHCLDTKIPPGQRLKDFSLYKETEEEEK